METLRGALRQPTPERIFQVKHGFARGMSVDEIASLTAIDPWFVAQMNELWEAEGWYAALPSVGADEMRRMKRMGFSDRQLAAIRDEPESDVRRHRWALGVRPAYKMVDTCAGEFPSATPYLYSSYDEESEAEPSGRRSVVILGSGPNRIGQGVEFDYCCVRAALALREAGYETIMVNSNPETVSTDFDISDKLYFEPLTLEDVLEIVEREKPLGVIVQLGGQTPLKLTRPLEAAGVNILGTTPDAIDIAEDRRRFEAIARKLGVLQPPNGTATSVDEAVEVAARVGYPVLVRPSYVLGGRAMEIVYDEPSLREYFVRAVRVSEDRPVLVDRFLEDAFEADVDAISDGKRVVIGGIMQHIEEAGIHSGDSACVLPPYLIGEKDLETMRRHTVSFAEALGVVGLINVQYAIKDRVVYVIEVNPRASRTIPFISKATGVPLASAAARVMLGETLEAAGVTEEIVPPYISVKEAVLPFSKFRESDPILGPGDAVDRRGHGHRRLVWRGLREGADGRGQHPADIGRDPHHGERPGQADGDAHCTTHSRDGISHSRDTGNGDLSARARHPGRYGHEASRGSPERDRLHRERRSPSPHQHPARQACPAGRLHDASGGGRSPCAVHDDHVGGERGVRRDSRASIPLAQREFAAGVARADEEVRRGAMSVFAVEHRTR